MDFLILVVVVGLFLIPYSWHPYYAIATYEFACDCLGDIFF